MMGKIAFSLLIILQVVVGFLIYRTYVDENYFLTLINSVTFFYNAITIITVIIDHGNFYDF